MDNTLMVEWLRKESRTSLKSLVNWLDEDTANSLVATLCAAITELDFTKVDLLSDNVRLLILALACQMLGEIIQSIHAERVAICN